MSRYKSPLGTIEYFIDDRIELLTHFLGRYVPRPNIEIEAKIGFYDPELTQDYRHISLLPSKGARFSSGLPKLMFDAVKQQLLKVGECQGHSQSLVEDTIYDSPEPATKFRKSRDKQTGTYSFMKKTRLDDLNFIVVPRSGLGFRISANCEELVEDLPDNAPARNIRNKSRDSFNFLYMRYDLTKVESGNNHTSELEIEIADVAAVRVWANAYNNRTDRGSLLGMATKFWHNILAVCSVEARAVVTPIREDKHFVDQRSEAYSQSWGGPQPVIGDYMFELAKIQADGPVIE